MELECAHVDIGLVTADPDAVLRFYVEVMQLDALPRPGPPTSGAIAGALRAGEQRIELVAPSPPPPRRPTALYAGNGYRVLSFLIDDIEAVCERIRDRGRRVAEGVDLPGKQKIRFAKDADGNMLELIQLVDPLESHGEPFDRIQVGLTVSDPARSRQFYGGTLGLSEQRPTPMRDGMTRYAFSAGATTLKFWSRGPGLPCLAGAPLDAIGIRSLRLRVRDLDAASHHLRRHEAPIISDVHDSDVREITIADPDGNQLRLCEAEPRP